MSPQQVLSSFLQRWQVGLSWQARVLVAVAGSWRVLELLIFASDVRRATPWNAVVAEHAFYRFHPMLTPLHELFILGSIIVLAYGIWAWRGGQWAWPAIFLAPLLGQQGLPLGWGLLALQPLLLLDAAQSHCPQRLRKWLPLIMITQLVLMYWGSAFGKDAQMWWTQGSALSNALAGDYLPTFIGHALGNVIGGTLFSEWLSRATVVAQFLMPVIFFLPSQRLFQVFKNLAITFHLLIAVLFHIAPFSLVCVAFWLSLRSSSAVERRDAETKMSWRTLCSGVALCVWLAGALTGTLRLHSDFLKRWSLSQSWRIMQRAEPRGHSLIEMPQKSFALQGQARWEMAAAFALSSTPKLRHEWLQAACGTGDTTMTLVVKHSHQKNKSEDYSTPCP